MIKLAAVWRHASPYTYEYSREGHPERSEGSAVFRVINAGAQTARPCAFKEESGWTS
jgi:hypothetical protein